ncbi:phosphoglycerate mutase-like protein [Massarina eburnea CBS 473.64]|uniref:3-phytase n=1 Tax=Massarina eburnea CBS 473.64 TaxID=1395130 RepID=A0A6A6RZF0_9PLEO|nr:phosphoglycerate mutase-like protein [Massarina eburnea CBS 473.64]
MPSLIQSPLTLILTILVAIVGLWCAQPSFWCAQLCSQSDAPETSTCLSHAGYFEYECAGKPHQASWASWHHPGVVGAAKDTGNSERAGTVTKDWNILYHLGGCGPWVEKALDIVEGGIAPPEGCEVEQVHMLSRHGERYPTKNPGSGMKALVERMKKSGIVFTDELAFFNNWDLFWTDDSQLEQLTSTGPFSGSLGSFTTGVRLRTRYHHLLSLAQSQFPIIKYWASDSPRVIDTARYFGAGFFGHDWQERVSLEIISESESMGADTLTPGDTCREYADNPTTGHDNGQTMMQQFRSTYLQGIQKRFLQHYPDIKFTEEEIYAMQEMCGFETTVRGSSHWCNVFTQEDFLGFEYARDLLHYYRAGPGTELAPLMGWLYLNATLNLMLEGPSAGPLFLTFVHDGDIAPMITALDIINDAEHLPITHIKRDRKWRKSQVSPMGGRTIFEVLSCQATGDSSPSKFVRLNINDGITAIPDCNSGPGRSCPLQDFALRTKRKGEEVGDFREKCGLSQDAADRITFLHQ